MDSIRQRRPRKRSGPRSPRTGGDARTGLLTALALCAPMSSQLVMLVMMISEGRWMFAAMVVPGMIGCAASAALSLMRTTPSPHDPPASDATADAAGSSRRPHPDEFASIACGSWETTTGFPRSRLAWRGIVHQWLTPTDMSAAIGQDGRGTFRLDLRAQGPHALVAGTTGSGKSVLLQTWCLALACANSPEQLNFVFLDFKGGSAFNRLERLPHTVGCVNDLDLAHAVRALEALENEIKRRERMVARQRVADVERLSSPPPRLMVVVDEFHALRSQLPDYVDRLVRVAALGRSLGMHVVACTQNPMGQVSADMKANIAVNICLRVRDPMQSQELLGSPLAAAISPAYPGAAYCNDGTAPTPLRCAEVHDIAAVTEAIDRAHRFCAMRPAAPLFSAPLPRVVNRPNRTPPAVDGSVAFALGDDGVTLHIVSLCPARGNVAVIGPRGRGKTTLLASLAHALRHAPGIRIRHMRPGIAAGSADPPGSPEPCVASAVRTVWIADDADALLDPLSADPLSETLRSALADPRDTVVFAVETSRHVRVPEHCTTRIVFPTGERPVDAMNGIPPNILARFAADDLDTPGRAVLLDRGQATPIQCFSESLGKTS